jgi:hypothetical protein
MTAAEVLGAMICASEIYSGKVLGVTPDDDSLCIQVDGKGFDSLPYTVTEVLPGVDAGDTREVKQVGVCRFLVYRCAKAGA